MHSLQALMIKQAIMHLRRVTQQTKVGWFFSVACKGSLPCSVKLLQHGLYASISYTSLSAACMIHSLTESKHVVSCLLQINLFWQIYRGFFVLYA